MSEPTKQLVRHGDVTIEILAAGTGPALVILPSYGRDGAGDYDDITRRVVAEGWKVLRPQPRGIGRSIGPMHGVTMLDLADDIARVIDALADGKAFVLGHAFGNQVARALAAEHRTLVRGTVLAAASASIVDPDVNKTPFIAGNPFLPRQTRLDALRTAFFALDHDPAPWLDGWYPATLAMQRAALEDMGMGKYWTAGAAPILEINAEHDPFKPKPYWTELRDQLGDRVTTIMIPGAAHALFPEQPVAVSDALLRTLSAWTSAT